MCGRSAQPGSGPGQNSSRIHSEQENRRRGAVDLSAFGSDVSASEAFQASQRVNQAHIRKFYVE